MTAGRGEGGGCKQAAEGPDSTQESGGGRDSILGVHKSDSPGSWSHHLRPWPIQSSAGTRYQGGQDATAKAGMWAGASDGEGLGVTWERATDHPGWGVFWLCHC